MLGSWYRKTEEDILEGRGREREGEHSQKRPSDGTVLTLWVTLHFYFFFTQKQTSQIPGRGYEPISETSVNPMAVRIFTLHYQVTHWKSVDLDSSHCAVPIKSSFRVASGSSFHQPMQCSCAN